MQLLFFRDALSGKIYEGKERIDGKVVIVTGANSGIGKETVKELANRGGKVYMACRDLQKCEEVGSKLQHEFCLLIDKLSICSLLNQKLVLKILGKYLLESLIERAVLETVVLFCICAVYFLKSLDINSQLCSPSIPY